VSTATDVLHPARAADLAPIVELLEGAGLPLAGLGAARLWVLEAHGAVVGVVGLEVHGDAALLRSLAVAPEQRGRGIGRRLVAHAAEVARARGCSLHLLTETAVDWFTAQGFVRIERDAAPAALRASRELQGACPDSAALLALAWDA
jgi:amino-acid N-acetyltransferase